MPYSKNPHRYPPELLELLALLQSGRVEQLRLPCETPQEANGRRVQIQSYFAAVEHYAKELQTTATRNKQKALSIGNKPASAARDSVLGDFADADRLTELWTERAYAAARWVVSTEHEPPAIVIRKRALGGSFGESLKAVLAQASAPAATPASADDQLSLLSAATQSLLGTPKTD